MESLLSTLSIRKRVALRLVRGGVIVYKDGRYSQVGWDKKQPQRHYRWLKRKGIIDVFAGGEVYVTPSGKAYL